MAQWYCTGLEHQALRHPGSIPGASVQIKMILWYIDESGITKEEKNLVVGGYAIHDNEYEKIIKEFRNIQKKHFGTYIRKIDMKMIIQGKKWLSPISIDKRREFLEDFYNFISKQQMRICICKIDKDASPSIRNKMQFAYECLFERICLNVEDISRKKENKELSILFTDTMTNLGEVCSWFKSFYEKGTEYVTNKHLIEKVIPLEMSQSEMLQISDLIVCTCSYWIKANKGQRSTQWAKETLEKGWKIILSKEHRVSTQDNKKEVQSIYFYSKP